MAILHAGVNARKSNVHVPVVNIGTGRVVTVNAGRNVVLRDTSRMRILVGVKK